MFFFSIFCISSLGYAAGMKIPTLILATFLAFSGPAHAQNGPVDVKIVIAVDASGSVDPGELKLQITGIANAFRDLSVQSAVRNGFHQSVLASVLVWSDAAYPKYPTKWHRLGSAGSFDAFAKEIEQFNLSAPGVPAIGGGGTNIGDALIYALVMLDKNPVVAVRNVVDISGDGPESKPWIEGAVELPQARALAAQKGVTVNGLAIETDIAGLHLYYENSMIVGSGAFVERALDFKDFQRAIIKKLLRELSSTPLAHRENGERTGRTRSSL
jgi:hypothetical protein